MTQPHSSTSHCSPTAAMTPGQTLMWFLGGIAAMFVIVSIAFGIKLATEGRLSLFGKGSQSVALQTSTSLPPDKPVPDNEPVTPPVSAATVSPGTSGGFVSGSENILPPEAAHLARSPVEASAAPLPTEAAHASTPAASRTPWRLGQQTGRTRTSRLTLPTMQVISSRPTASTDKPGSPSASSAWPNPKPSR